MTIDRRTLLAAAAGLMAGAGLASSRAKAAERVPRIALRHAFSVSIFFDERAIIQSAGRRVFVPTVGGEVWGPRLTGRVVPYGGADFAGGGLLDAHYMLQATDGALIYIHNRGYMKRLGGEPQPLATPAPLNPGEPLDQRMPGAAGADAPLRMRLTPTFDAPKGPHEWLARTLFVGHGARFADPDHTIFTYYEVL